MQTVVVVPTYQEADNIVRFLTEVREAVPDAHILIVDDNSPDGTGHLADETAARLGNIRVLHRAAKQGLGSAYRNGFDVVLTGAEFPDQCDVVVSMDCDFSHDPRAIASLVARVEAGADAVIGSRYVPGGSTVNWPLHRRLLSRWGNLYTSGILRLHVHDCTSGFRAYRASALRTIDPTSTSAEGYAFLTELVRRLVRNGFTVEESPIRFADREAGSSKMSSRIISESMLLVTGWAAKDLWRTVRRQQPERRQGIAPNTP
ncbi:MAG TPA: polyprenol monophosphomannose synthase [Ilumatobacteraceae bacterium]